MVYRGGPMIAMQTWRVVMCSALERQTNRFVRVDCLYQRRGQTIRYGQQNQVGQIN